MILKNIKVLIWDFDGTLYKLNPKLWKQVREAEYRTIMDYKNWDRDRAIKEFNKYYKIVTPSATQTVGRICGIKTHKAARHMEKYYDRRDFLKRDNRLVQLFAKLKNFSHFILANGVKPRLEQTLVKLGLDKNIFEEIVTSEISGENKPSNKGFRFILNKTKLPANEHLMVGDREEVDIYPANKLGMKTCLVFSKKKGKFADVTLPDVYSVANLLV